MLVGKTFQLKKILGLKRFTNQQLFCAAAKAHDLLSSTKYDNSNNLYNS